MSRMTSLVASVLLAALTAGCAYDQQTTVAIEPQRIGGDGSQPGDPDTRCFYGTRPGFDEGSIECWHQIKVEPPVRKVILPPTEADIEQYRRAQEILRSLTPEQRALNQYGLQVQQYHRVLDDYNLDHGIARRCGPSGCW